MMKICNLFENIDNKQVRQFGTFSNTVYNTRVNLTVITEGYTVYHHGEEKMYARFDSVFFVRSNVSNSAPHPHC